MAAHKKSKKKSGKKGLVKKVDHPVAEPERGFIPYCRRFMNTWKATYRDFYSL